MIIESNCLVPSEPGPIWALISDIPRTAYCVPGLQEIEASEDGTFQATIKAKVGPISLTFSGTIQLLEQDSSAHSAKFRIQGSDRRVGGSFQTTMTVRLIPQGPNETQLDISADTTFMGKLGEFGQPIIRRKTASTIDQFAKNLTQKLMAQA
ncbi:MAG: hypothetical protein BZY81_00315 [SAR202 cluster bacterium Io17-Chloro-G4]|nr:MAG: hypothetical protein BZY81_00315 [SAR202 cluster bacterium Io17-Chloro-G4]